MKKFIEDLEKFDNKDRTNYIKQTLKNTGISFEVQPFRQRILKGENIIVTKFCENNSTYLLLTAHTNKWFSSPGANDNASGVAVLLGVIERLTKKISPKSLGVKIVFLDHEDGLAYTDGSTYYAKNADKEKITFVLNLDMVGMGDAVTLSQQIETGDSNPYKQYLLEYLKSNNVDHCSYDIPAPFLIEDHLPFIKRNIPALSLNLMPKKDLEYLKKGLNASKVSQVMEALFMRFRRNSHPMFIMRHRHNELDTSEFISESSLELCREIVLDLINFHIDIIQK